MNFVVGEQKITCRDVLAAGSSTAKAVLSPASLARIEAGASLVEQQAGGEKPIYGVNTGLGGNLGHRIPPDEIARFQQQIVFGRMIAFGEALDPALCRSILFCRLIELASGATGVSAETVALLFDMYNRGVTPVIPSLGTISASDIGLMAHMAAVAVGHGEAWYGGERMSGREALARAGLTPVRLKVKDGIGLINHAAATSASGALAVNMVDDLIAVLIAVSALSYEGYAANPSILDERLHAARPAAGQIDAAALLRGALAGSGLFDAERPRNVQDALSFRLLAPALGATLSAVDFTRREIETEINGVVVTPMVLIEDGTILSSPNFHTPSLSLAFDSLAISLTHLASLTAFRLAKLMTAALSGLPKYLSPIGGGSAGYVTLQKAASALFAEIRSRCMPVGIDAFPVSDTVEDVASYTYLAIAKLRDQLKPFRYLIAIEALTAAQAVDLRKTEKLGAASAIIHRAIREVVPGLDQDRPPGADVEAVAKALFDPALIARLHAILLR